MAEWQQVFEDHHDVWAETMRHGSELLSHPQMSHLGEPVELPDAERGPVRQPGPIARLEKTPAVLLVGAPPLDADGPALRADPWPATADAGGQGSGGQGSGGQGSGGPASRPAQYWEDRPLRHDVGYDAAAIAGLRERGVVA